MPSVTTSVRAGGHLDLLGHRLLDDPVEPRRPHLLPTADPREQGGVPLRVEGLGSAHPVPGPAAHQLGLRVVEAVHRYHHGTIASRQRGRHRRLADAGRSAQAEQPDAVRDRGELHVRTLCVRRFEAPERTLDVV